MKKVLLSFIFLVMCMTLVSGSVVTLSNTNSTIVLHPSETHNFYYIDGVIGSTSNVIIASNYIEISYTPFHVVSQAPTNIYIKDWFPQYINLPGHVIFNFTVSTQYHNQTLTFVFGNISNVPLIIYKDGKPWMITQERDVFTFLDNNSKYNIYSDSCIMFSDGKIVGKKLNERLLSIHDLLSNINKYNKSDVVIKGMITQIKDSNNIVLATITDGSGFMVVQLPKESPIQTKQNITVIGKFIYSGKLPIVVSKVVYLNNLFSGFSNHTYTIKTLGEQVALLPMLGAPLPFLNYRYIGYAIMLLILIPSVIIIYVVYRRYKGKM